MSKLHILLLFGGESAEHDVSINSARNIYDALDKQAYDVSLCYIDRKGQWWHASRVEAQEQPNNELMAIFGKGEFATRYGERLRPDMLFPVLHGPNGEDGSVQGVAQLLHLPVVGCGIVGSAICMDKDVTKRLLMQEGISVVATAVHRVGDTEPDYDALAKQLGQTLFVKPANLGSSIGVSKVANASELAQALGEAHSYDHKIIIERAIIGRELECAVLGNDDPKASILGEIKPGEVFYSYSDKYASDSTAETTTEPDLPEDVSVYIRDVAVRAYKVLECRGLARVDFFLADDGQVFVNEVNTLPGFTNISMYPKLWEASGLGYSQLLDKLVELALAEYTRSTHKE